MPRLRPWYLLGCLTFSLVFLTGCDLLKKEPGGSGKVGADGLPTECGDYLAVYECTLAKGGAPNAHDTAEQLRSSYKAMSSSVGAAQLAKTCIDSAASTKDLADKVGCAKGSLAVTTPAATTAATATPSPVAKAAPPKAAPATAPKAASTASASTSASAAASAKSAAKKHECSCDPGQVLFSDKDTSICAVLPCKGPGVACKKEDRSEGTCIEIGTGQAGERERCGHLIQCL